MTDTIQWMQLAPSAFEIRLAYSLCQTTQRYAEPALAIKDFMDHASNWSEALLKGKYMAKDVIEVGLKAGEIAFGK